MIAVTAAIAVSGVVACVARARRNAQPGTPAADRAELVDRAATGCSARRSRFPRATTTRPVRSSRSRSARVPAGDASRRIGSLLVNPGGPGLSAIDVLARLAASLPASITDRFDVVAIDPRGVGQERAGRLRRRPRPGVRPLVRADDRGPARRTGRGACSRSPTRAPRTTAPACPRSSTRRHGTRHGRAARPAWATSRLTYLGFSYGTYLGALYAALFPSRVRALVLDGAVDPSVDARASTLLQARGFEQSLDHFLAWCAENDDECAFGADGDPATALRRAARTHRHDADLGRRRARRATRRAPSGCSTTPGSTRRCVQQLYVGRAGVAHARRRRSPTPTRAWRTAARRRRPLLRPRARRSATTGASRRSGPSAASTTRPRRRSPTSRRRAQEVAPRVGAFVANFSLACSVWPTRALPRTVVPHVRRRRARRARRRHDGRPGDAARRREAAGSPARRRVAGGRAGQPSHRDRLGERSASTTPSRATWCRPRRRARRARRC